MPAMPDQPRLLHDSLSTLFVPDSPFVYQNIGRLTSLLRLHVRSVQETTTAWSRSRRPRRDKPLVTNKAAGNAARQNASVLKHETKAPVSAVAERAKTPLVESQNIWAIQAFRQHH